MFAADLAFPRLARALCTHFVIWLGFSGGYSVGLSGVHDSCVCSLDWSVALAD